MSMSTHGGTRTRSLGIRSPTPYPLGHAGIVAAIGFDPMTSGLWAQHASSPRHTACGYVEIEGIDPTTSRMQSERSTI